MGMDSTGFLLLQQARPGIQLPLWRPSICIQHPRPTLVHFRVNLWVTPVYYRRIWSVTGIVCSLICEDSHAFASSHQRMLLVVVK
jgi:hypothetical protein